MDISQNGLHLIEGFEGWSSAPYWDRYGGVWTRGFGETEGIGPNSPHISRSQGEANLKTLIIRRYEYAIHQLGIPLNQNQFDALSSFVWNLGPGILDRSTSIGERLRRRDYRGAADAMLQYDHAGGIVLQGLKTRREAERMLFLSSGNVTPPDAGILTSGEAQAIKRYQELQPHHWRHPIAWQKAKNLIVDLRKEIWTAAEKGYANGKATDKGWNINHRAQRYNILWRYR